MLLTLACAPGPHLQPERPGRRKAPLRVLPRLGYALQAGAFAKVENAARFSESLQAQGLEAAYYGSSDGIYRVRFGDFATKATAQAKGEALRSAGIIEAFWVVAPSERLPDKAEALETLPRDEKGLRANLVGTAKGYLGVPYLFGGTKEQGFDCSGLTGAVYRLNGLQLPRTSGAQFEAGNPVDLDEARPGDLVFFGSGGSSRVTHVGMLVGARTFIHAPRPGHGIRQDDLNEPYYQKHFLGARSYL
ncbi:MAG TPA: NlpC/P60 family protein [Geothrix sp.]|nr:NlpC/P60 family protein [Geothrix sp.]